MVSTIENHTIPPFYACYLLHSKSTSRYATYIGSTPDPPRRIKQHNGLILGVSYALYTCRLPWVFVVRALMGREAVGHVDRETRADGLL